MFVETSASTDENVSVVFESLFNMIVDQGAFTNQNLETSKQCLRLHDPELDKDESGCCQ